MPHTPESVLQDLKQGRYAPIYFLQGEESFYIDQIADFIEAHALQEFEKGFNQVIIYGKDADMAKVLNNARRFPMMAERQVVLVKEAQEITDLNRDTGQQMLEAYVRNPLPSTILVFCHKHKTLDGRKKLAQVLDKQAVLVTTKKLYDNQVPQWIERYLQEKKRQAMPDAVQLIAESIGADLSRLSNEIDKLLINLREGATITPDVVQQYIGISKDYNVFELQRALVYRDADKAYRIVHYFESDPKSHPIIPIIALLFTFFCKVLTVHAAADQSERGLAKALKINPFFVKEYLIAKRNYPPPRVAAAIHHLRTADLQSKGVEGGSITEGQILKELIFKILH
ncbi:DNA polymerase III, delta subunit [Catalinimonas alkaloidigena]|uniref:DNA polymerase III subunit delta n=1 Tax=Catalinimonas alkaloidigena TaxID=1075417 RepID=A0A1G9GVB7_9BACT|nr:DNA polymerase III subunit delta [Catalinimonas alkaloidigena]SDL04629.1 DNA polymerase III, delta subunit [Catalinimonas alkaloidigena]